jgi:CHAT domain-containing protein
MIRTLVTRRLPSIVAIAIAAAIFAGPTVRPAWAQVGMHAPNAKYYGIFGVLYDGDYNDALREFEEHDRAAIKTPQSRWIDSICYETMCGECYYQMGVFDEALRRYTNALDLFKRFSDWMVAVQFQSIRAAGAGARKPVPWGASSRQSQLGAFSMTAMIPQTYGDIVSIPQQGPMVIPRAILFPITPQEIVRATCLAMRRRAELLGPTAKYDPLTSDLMAATAQTIGPANHWSAAWVNLERGLALLAGGKDTQATSCLKEAVLAGGEFDHPLTSIALFELGKQALLHGDYPAAAKFFEETTYAAVNSYSDSLPADCGVLEEAFRYGAITHLMVNGRGVYPLLEPAIQWAKLKGLRQLRASLLLSAAENYAALGQTRQAAAMLDEARSTIARRKMGSGAIGARFNYLTALVAFQQARIAEGNTSLAAAMDYMRHGSFWLFHIGLADGLYVSGSVTPRTSLELFGDVLRDPQPGDWAFAPMESLSVLTTPHPVPFEHWFEAALDRGNVSETPLALEIADRARRHRFFSSMEFGGRLESLRWILEAPAAALPQQARLERQDMLVRYPAYAQLSQRVQAIRVALAKLPLVADDAPTLNQQQRQLAEAATIGLQQEAVLREVALRREPAELVFPPLRTVAQVQKSLPDKQAALVFFVAGQHWYGFLLNKDRCTQWRINSPPAVITKMQTMLREMGQYGANHEMAIKDLAGDKWRKSGKQVLDLLLKGSPADFSQPFDELMIVPDGPLWYLPFEALQVTVADQPQSLLSRFRIRYAPTLSLCTSQRSGGQATGATAVVVGKLYPRDDAAVARAAFEQLSAVVPGAAALRLPLPASSSIYSTLFQRLIVLDDLAGADRDPYGWAPVPLDRSKAGGLLIDWLSLPWGGPEVVVLPGFHTAAEDALKPVGRHLPTGNEMFLSICGLMANGARTVLLSRWRCGGQTSFDLVREFTQELPNTSPADAWQRAVLLAVDSRLNVEAEPRIKRGPSDDPPKANNPFFWAGFMLVDCGTAAEKQPAKAEEPAARPKKPPAPAEIAQPEGKGRPKKKDTPPKTQ